MSAHSGIDGIGFSMLNKKICFIDIDDCVHDNLTIDSEVFKLMNSIGSYAEFSPSRDGIHIYCAGELDSYGSAPDDSRIEISAFDRSWATVTFDHIKTTPTTVKSSPNNLKRLCKEYNLAP
ncbi:hypothetical protein [Natrialba aegyptia]|uniref:hypothetical protein n=1 Tax=Natrialba aegyptia TaxID=129789 RepID=UPI001267C32B|nr:hypothetical protein [Natrialba aegyptia]